MADDAQWQWWIDALDGKRGELTRGDPKSGFFRASYRDENRKVKWKACAIWRDDDGQLRAKVSHGFCPRNPGEIDDAFGSWSMHPISYELYQDFLEKGLWPEDIEPAPAKIGDNSAGMALDAQLKLELDDLREQAKSWLATLAGGKPTTQAEADKVGNYAERFAEIERKATQTHKVEKQPFLEGGKKVDAAWKPLIELADESKRWLKRAAEDFLKAEAKRLADEQKRAADAYREASGKSAAPIEPMPVLARPSAGSGRKVSLRTRTVYQITDLAAVAAYIAALEPANPDFADVCQRLVNRMCAAGVKVPGAEAQTESYAA